MAHYGLRLKGDEVISIEADFFEIRDGFFRFYLEIMQGTLDDSFAVYAVDVVHSCVEQNEYTEAELLAQIAGDK